MTGGYAWKESAEDGGGQSGKGTDQPRALADLHQPQPQREDARQADRDIEAGAGGAKGGRDDLGEDVRIVKKDEPACSDREGDHDKGNPDVVKRHAGLRDSVPKRQSVRVCGIN